MLGFIFFRMIKSLLIFLVILDFLNSALNPHKLLTFEGIS